MIHCLGMALVERGSGLEKAERGSEKAEWGLGLEQVGWGLVLEQEMSHHTWKPFLMSQRAPNARHCQRKPTT
jgi:hypothetical protein